MNLVAGNAAARRARVRWATIAVDGMVFHRPVAVGDEVGLYATVGKIGRTSPSVDVEAWRCRRDADEMVKVIEARFTFVALGGGGRPRPMPT